ncbi:hypothetical protein C8R43DRAFT_626102 [Mycena crocata]|nr:hypothetical protein C8R43DRAFT_626102 [Mycena crocata]
MFFTASVTLLFSSLVAAQYGGGYGDSGSSPTTSAAASAAPAAPSAPADTADHKNVNVAPGNFSFSPASIIAPNGTTVTFWFPNNGLTHSVTQSSFANPCTYLAASANNTAGFDSGLTAATQFSIFITDDSKPIWYHCKQITHCGVNGMVGSINAPTTGNTFEAFQAAAMKQGSSEVTEKDGGAVTGGFNAIASLAPTNTGSGAAPAATTPSSATVNAGISVFTALLGFAVMFAAMA